MLPLTLNASITWIVASLLIGILLLFLRPSLTRSRYEFVELVRWVIIPYIAMLAGHLSPRLMGLSGHDWRTTFEFGLGICCGFLALVFLAKITNSGSMHTSAVRPQSQTPFSGFRFPALEKFKVKPDWLLWIIFLAFAREFHWTFLRAGIWENLLRLENPVEIPAYTAVWSAGAIAFIEILIHRRGSTQWIWQLMTLLLTSVLFFYTRSFYLCALLHAGITLVLPNQLQSSSARKTDPRLRIETQQQSLQQISEQRQ